MSDINTASELGDLAMRFEPNRHEIKVAWRFTVFITTLAFVWLTYSVMTLLSSDGPQAEADKFVYYNWLFAILLLGYAGYWLAKLLKIRGKRIELHTNGLIITRGANQILLPWRIIRMMEARIDKQTGASSYIPTMRNSYLTITRRNGETETITHFSIDQMNLFVKLLREATEPRGIEWKVVEIHSE